jgi:hypothetical protein
LQYTWVDGFTIQVSVSGGEVQIEANQAGLMSLANHLVVLAQKGTPRSGHIHLDEHNALEGGSTALVIGKLAG